MEGEIRRMNKMKKGLLLTTLCSILVITSGCTQVPKLQNGEEVVVSIDGLEVTAEELYSEMKKQAGTSIMVNIIDEYIANQEIETDQTAEDYADSQVEQLKAQYEAAGRDFTAALISSGYADENDLREAIIVDYKKSKVAENWVKSEITDDEINKYYEEEIFGEITAKHILVKPVTTSDMTDEEKAQAEEEALNKAKDLITQLNEGADFDTLAKENSDDTASASEGGLISDFTKQDVVSEFWDAAYALEDGKYTTEPVKSSYGYHIILKVSAKEKPALEDVKDDIITEIADNKLSEDTNLTQKAWAEVRKKYNITINDSDIKGIYDSAISSLD